MGEEADSIAYGIIAFANQGRAASQAGPARSNVGNIRGAVAQRLAGKQHFGGGHIAFHLDASRAQPDILARKLAQAWPRQAIGVDMQQPIRQRRDVV